MFTRKNLIKLSRILFSLFITCLFMTCDPGLGKAVDTQAPKVSIDYPAPKEVLKDSFTMTGVASDEVKVASCEVAFRNIKTGSVYKFPANVANDKFSVTINTPKPDGSFELPDGDYNVTVSVSDAYRDSTQDIVYTIDNTAPTVLITSPNSYSESNWPNMYKTFSIKGEVYDATNISEVIVYLVDVNGTVLKQVVAEGTNTFSARFDNPFGEEKVCFYYAVAKDAGGNVNTYCYHSSDIRKLLANAAQHSETTSFPSINSIGYVDQGQEKNLTELIDKEQLKKIKIDNNKAEKKADSFPGLKFFAQDTAQVKWLNISKENPDSVSGIAIGSPILGTIMPPTDQSAIDYSSISVWVAKSTDGTSTNFEPFTDDNKLKVCVIKEGEEGDKQVKLTAVGESLNFQVDSHPGNDDNWPTGNYKVKIYFKTDSNIEGFDECRFEVTSGAPKLSEGNFAKGKDFSSYYRGYMTEKTVQTNENFLGGKATSSDGNQAVELKYDCAGTREFSDRITPSADGSYKIPVEINPQTHENDGEYTYTLTAAPDSTLTTVISRVLVIDTTNPEIILNNLENGRILDEGTYTVKGNIDDANGIKEVHYKLFADETQITLDGSPANDWILIDGAKSTVELKLSNLEVNKNYTLKLRATDIAGNTNGENDYTYTFTLDNVKPEISTTVSPLIMYDNDGNAETPEEETVNGTIKVNTKVSDSNKLKAVYYTFNTSLVEEADWSTQNKFTDVELSNGKIIEVDTTKYADKLPLRIKAIDGAGNYTIKIVNPVINQESDKPIIAPSNFSELNNIEDAGMTVSGGVNVYTKTNPNMIFTVSDDDLVKGYFVKINEGNYKNTPEAEVNLSQKIMSYSVKDLDYGRHTLTFKIIDQNYKNDVETPNSFVEQKFYVAIDDGQPQLSLNNANNQFVGERFDISGKVLDENGIECIHLQAKESSGIYTSLVLGNGLNDDGTFSYEFPVPSEKESIVITAVDKIGNSSSVDFTYLVDNAKPTVQVTTRTLAVNSDSPLTRVEGYAFDSESSQSDKSGIDQVRLKVGSSITGINDEESILATGSIDNNGQLTWDATLDLSDLDNGTYNIYVVAFDNAGNMSYEDIATVSIDADVPLITHSYNTIDPQDYTRGEIGVKTESFIIEGFATDSSGIKTVTAKIQGQNDNLAGGYDKDTGRWEFTVPTTNDGSLVIVVSAIDNCNKRSVDVNLTVKLDSKVPSVEFTNIDANGSSKQTGSAPYVTVSCSDETSGVKNFDYKFYYKSNNADDFVEYSDDDASGTIEFEEDTNSRNIRINMASRTSANGKGPFIDQSSETDGLWKLWYSLTDNADHVVEGWSPEFIVDRHVPTLTVNNVNDLIKQGDALTVSGSVVDKFGGTIDHVTVSVIHNSYNSDDLAKFKKTFTINDGLVWNDSESVYDWTVTWDENNSPFKYPDNYEIVITAYDIAENQYEIKPGVSCDNTAPKIIFTKPYSYSVDSNGKITEGTVINSPIGNTAVNANIDKDEFRMKEIYYQIGGTAEVFAEGTKGTAGYKVTGVSVINGGIQDVDEDGVMEDPIPELKGFWKKLTDANHGLTADINTLTYFTEGKTKELLDNDDSNDKAIIQTLEIHLVAIDAAGNINYCAMPIKVDTDTDKPEVLVLSPKTVLEESKLVANVGGTTTLSGTVSDDNSVHSVWVNVELDGGNYVDGILKSRLDSDIFSVDYSKAEYEVSNPQSITVDEENKTFTLPVDDANYFESKNKWYKVNLGENGKTTTTWNLMLNKDGEFDIAGNLQKYFATNVDLEETSLKIRVIALDEKADDEGSLAKTKLSDIKEFTLKIDSGSPSIIIKNIDKIPVEGSYIGGNINYELTFVDDGQITYWSVTAKGNKGEYEIASGSPMDNSHDETITLNTTEINDRCGNVITLKIYAEDNSKDTSGQFENNKTSEETFKYTIDNSAPIASIAETIDGNPYLIATESVVGDTTGDHREIESRGNHLRIKTDEALLEGKISDEINGSGIDYVMLYFTKMENGTRYIYNAGINENNKTAITNKISLKDKDGVEQQIYFPLESLKNVSRNNNCQSTTDYIIIDKAEGALDNGSNGDRDGYDENIKATGEWMLSFDSTNLKDGVYDITYVVVDIAGNARFYTDSMFVQNHAPMINSVVLATDVNADGNCIVDELNEDGESERFDTSDEISNTGFTVRNNVLKIKVNVSGGTEPLKYFLKYRNLSNVEVTTDTSNEGYSNGIFTVTDFPQDGKATYTVWVEDSVEANLSLSSGTTEIGLTLDNQDNVKPVTQLFELNTTTEESKNSNKSRGSLYTILDSGLNEIVQGHIEPRENSTYDNTDANDPDVSGTIILRGESYDDQRISSISLNLNGNIVAIANWENNKLVGKNGATIKDELGLSGHYVEWAYPWDTNSIASQNVNVSVITQDASANKNEEKEYESSDNIPKTVENKFSNFNWGYSKMTVDVVPYITDIKRNGGYMTKRTRSGSYPLLRGEEGNTVIGFNLTAGTIKLTIASDKNGSTTLATMESIETSGSNITFTVPKTAKDGYLHLTVSNIPSVNNTNERSLESNVEAKDATSKFWTDDRFIRVWQDTDRFGNTQMGTGEMNDVELAKNPAYPAMAMDASGKLYASFTNYSMHNVYYTTVNGNSTAVFNGYDSPEETTIFVTGTGDAPIVNVAYMANYQSGGSYNNWSANRADAGGLHLYDPKISSLGSEHFSDFRDCYMSRYELLYHDKQFQQFKNFRLVRKDINMDGYIHTAYYDIDTMSIHYSNISMNMYHVGRGNFEASWVNIDGTYDEHDYAALNGTKDETKGTNIIADEAKNITLGMEYESEVFKDGLTRSSATGEYVGIDLTNDKYFPVLAYYDSVNKVVKLARANVENPKKAENNWTIQRVITDSTDPNYTTTNGNYVDMQIDSKGYVHVVFVNGRGELIYVKSTNNPNDGNSPYVFGKSVVIAENSPMNVDITVRETTPYIGYLSSLGSFDGLNTAFYDKSLDLNNDGITEGGWETMSAPLSHTVSNNRASVEAHPSPTTSSWESAHAYFSGGYYRAAYYIGNGKGH